MKRYIATVMPETSLFIARERGNRVIRHSFHYIPASTIGGALNSYLYQIGWEDVMGQFRFSNLYPQADDEKQLWLPSPANVYFCPKCQEADVENGGKFITSLAPAQALAELVCECNALRRVHQGFVQARLNDCEVQVNVNKRRMRLRDYPAQVLGRTELHRTTGGHVDGRLHGMEILKVRGKPFCGDVWVEDRAAEILAVGNTLRLSLGGLRSRGCGQVELQLHAAAEATRSESQLLLVETPLLPLSIPAADVEEENKFKVEIRRPYARVDICERWSVRRKAPGLMSFDSTLAMGSVIKVAANPAVRTAENMFFYSLEDTGGTLYRVALARLDTSSGLGGYSLRDLWSLGFGRLRWLTEERA